MFRVIACLLLLLFSTSLHAKVILPAIFGSGMVLQQNENVKFWGTANRNANLTIATSWDKKVYKLKTNANGEWQTKIATPKAGGPFNIIISDGNGLTLNDVLIGEVWLCSGQSNMEMPVKGFANQPILNSADLLLDAEETGVRLFMVPKNMSKQALDTLTAKWQHTSAKTVREFSAIGYQFARMLQQKLGVPIGIIQSAYGGTDIEAWITQDALKDFNDFKVPTDAAKMTKNHPSVLFNAMINPILGFQIKGVLWYQGENNRFNPLSYDRKMAAMVSEWRRLWDIGEWPFYYVQIAPNRYKDVKENIPLLYEAQAKAQKIIPNAAMVVSVDVGSHTTIHPPDKTTISKRLAFLALAKNYGKEGLPISGPTYKALKIEGGKAVVNFDNVPLGLTAYNQKLVSFEIAGEDQVFVEANAVIAGKTVVVASDKVKQPVAVRYAFKDESFGNLYNVEGLPLAPFRTDDWPIKNP